MMIQGRFIQTFRITSSVYNHQDWINKRLTDYSKLATVKITYECSRALLDHDRMPEGMPENVFSDTPPHFDTCLRGIEKKLSRWDRELSMSYRVRLYEEREAESCSERGSKRGREMYYGRVATVRHLSVSLAVLVLS